MKELKTEDLRQVRGGVIIDDGSPFSKRDPTKRVEAAAQEYRPPTE